MTKEQINFSLHNGDVMGTFNDFSDRDWVMTMYTESIATFRPHKCYLGYVHVIVT